MTGAAKVVARYLDGKVLKGYTQDFNPDKPSFHLMAAHPLDLTCEICLKDLKAVFFVRTFEGMPRRAERKDFTEQDRMPGRRMKVRFKDGEIVPGVTLSYHPSRPGFFLTPADGGGNNERVYVVAAAVAMIH